MLLVKNKPIRLFFGLLETFNLLSLKLWIKNPTRAKAFSGRVFRDYMGLVARDKWVSRPIDGIIPDFREYRITIENSPGGGIATPIDELAYLALITKNLSPKHIFEIGTYHGRTALNFALNSPSDCLVYTLDLPPSGRDEVARGTNPHDAAIIHTSTTGIHYQGKDVSNKIRQLFGNSQTYDFSPYHGQMDLVFVDGAHHYDAVRSDTLNALKLVRDGGFVIWHDFGNYGDYNDVTRAVLKLLNPMEVVQIDNTQLAVYRKPISPITTSA
jgi:predicted O-methyltransferase YrrM